MATIGYARVSTTDQNLDAQIEQLKAVGVEKLYEEKASGAKQDRPQLAAMLDYAREGDSIVVTKLDRLGRSLPHLLQTVEALKEKGVTLRVLNINLDTGTPTGKLMLTMLGAIGQFEREMLLERQREGIEVAKQKGVYKGRKPTAREKTEEVLKLVREGKSKASIADQVGIGIASVFRILRENKDAASTSAA